MILTILFVVFFIFALVSSGPWASPPLSSYGWVWLLLCVGILGYVVFHGTGLRV